MANSRLNIPFPHRVSPDLERARQHGPVWARETGMVTGDAAAAYWEALLLPEQAGFYWPYAAGEDIELAVDFMTFYYFFDDQFDAELGRSVAEVRRVIGDLVEVTRGIAHRRLHVPIVTAFSDLWRRATEGMSPLWRERFGRNWRDYFYGYVSEAVDRHLGTAHQWDTYLAGRRYSVGAQTSTDLCERFGHFEVPEEALAHPHLQVMRQIICDVLAMSNDLHSFEKESALGETNNFIQAAGRTRRLPTDAAVAHVRAEGERLLARFAELEREIPRIVDALGPAEHRRSVTAYVDALKASLRGYDAWGNVTPRYRAEYSRPGSALAHVEDLTRSRT
ncbi:terpene synthase family protein [Streptomyces cavernae]|uniref:terpene synthase family protein n=1 Tax=Streptomyces cavernae TaxID=2259034 RepID=UPI000FEBD66E|nr:hypothetical protein [Streptomyces cavernae]